MNSLRQIDQEKNSSQSKDNFKGKQLSNWLLTLSASLIMMPMIFAWLSLYGLIIETGGCFLGVIGLIITDRIGYILPKKIGRWMIFGPAFIFVNVILFLLTNEFSYHFLILTLWITNISGCVYAGALISIRSQRSSFGNLDVNEANVPIRAISCTQFINILLIVSGILVTLPELINVFTYIKTGVVLSIYCLGIISLFIAARLERVSPKICGDILLLASIVALTVISILNLLGIKLNTLVEWIIRLFIVFSSCIYWGALIGYRFYEHEVFKYSLNDVADQSSPKAKHRLNWILEVALFTTLLITVSCVSYFVGKNKENDMTSTDIKTTIVSPFWTEYLDASSASNTEVKEKYEEYFGEKYGWNNKKVDPFYGNSPNKYNVYLLDLTHDGVDEMVVLDDTVDREETVELTVYKYTNREVKAIYSISSTKMARDKLFAFYYSGEHSYLLVSINDMWMTGGTVSYEVFSFNESNEKNILISDTYTQYINPDIWEELDSGYYDFIDRKEKVLDNSTILFDCREIFVRQSDPSIVFENASQPDASLKAGEAIILEKDKATETITTQPEQNNGLQIKSGIVAAGTNFTIMLKDDGTVITLGDTNINTSEWRDIIQVAADGYFAIGLKSDGTVVASGDLRHGEGDVSSWRDVVQVACGYRHTIAVTKEGTVYYTGADKHGRSECRKWTHVVKVLAGSDHVAAILDDGTVLSAGYPADNRLATDLFQNVVEGDIGTGSTFCVLRDGTVRETGASFAGEDNIGDWTNIVAISAENEHTVGLKKDGTVIAIGSNHYGECDTMDWTSIIAIATGQYHTVGVRSDGTVLAVGSNQYGQINVDEIRLW